jgi:hypothetical protein
MPLTSEQKTLLDHPSQSKLFLHGMAGTGKTTAGASWLKNLLKSGIPAHEILIFVPQRALATPYLESLREADVHTHSLVNSITLGGLARRMVDLYWPIISQDIGVAAPNRPPHFLTLETAQYYMAHLVRPLIDHEGFFESLTINRNRIYSQILDNLNKAAFVGFSHQEIGERLKSAWVGDIEQLHIYEDVQSCVNRFRNFCLDNNLLDFSLQVEIFLKHLWPNPLCRNYLTRTFRHVIVDNLEEDTPISHRILREWLPDFESALLIFDEGAGFRYFLGADVASAFALQEACEKSITFEQNLVNDPGISHLKVGIQNAIARLDGEPETSFRTSFDILKTALVAPAENPKYFPAMVQWVTDKIADLVKQGIPPGEIVVLAPFMPDVLRFALSNQLNDRQIPNQSHRPSRSLRDEPATQTMLTLAAVAFPAWEMLPKRINLAFALMQAIEGLDLVRAQLLTAYIYKQTSDDIVLHPFEAVPAEVRDRITYRVGERYDRLKNWLEANPQDDALTLDFFLNRLFGEVLSQPGFNFHNDLDSANTIANLVESIQKFRWAMGDPLPSDAFVIGKEYVQMVHDGVIAAQYVHERGRQPQEAVFLAPAYTFLINNQAVDYQFWLDIGSPSWYQRLNQPLTQPYVLSRGWETGKVWTAEDELRAAHQTLQRLSIGLLNRCRKKVYIGMSELDIRGYENRGLLIRILQGALQTSHRGAK